MRGAGAEIHGHAVESIGERNAGVAITGDGVVAAQAFELVESSSAAIDPRATGIGVGDGSRIGESRRNVCIGEVGAADRFDRSQCVRPNRWIARYDAGGQVDVDAGSHQGITVVVSAVKTSLTVDKVISGAAGKFFRRIVGIIGAGEAVIK